MTRLWRFRAANTHLYPDARLLLVEPGGRQAVADAVQVSFADLGVAHGHIDAAEGARLRIELQGYRTARGTVVARRAWVVESLAPGQTRWRVAARAEPNATTSPSA